MRLPMRLPPPPSQRIASSLLRGLLLLLAMRGVAQAEPRDDARRHFAAGLQAAKTGDYQGALDEFLAAQAAWPHPKTLQNIGRAYYDLGDLDKAIEYYTLFRDTSPQAAAEADPILAVLEARRRAATAPVAPVAPLAPVEEGAPAAATSAEIERLAAIAAELAALSSSLSTRAPAPPSPAPAPVDGPPTAAPPAPPVAVPEVAGGFQSEAYGRVVVTASRYGQDPLDSPSSVTILTEDDIRQSGATSIPDLLRQVVGVDVMALSSGKPDVSIRGFNRELSNKVLVLVDGRSVYLDVLGTPIWASLEISIEEIERIEIIRGPGSAVYGANAVTGVVNIITRTPGEGDNILHAEGGTPGYGRGAAVVTGRQGRSAWRLSAGYGQDGRWSAEALPAEGGPLSSDLVEDQSMSTEAVRGNVRFDRTFGDDGFVSMSGGYAKGYAETYVIGALGDYNLTFDGGYARADLSYGSVHLRGFFNHYTGQTGPWLSYVGERDLSTNVNSDVGDLELETNQRFSTGSVEHRVNVGLGYRRKAVDFGYLKDSDGEPIVEHHISAFGQEEAKVGPLTLVGSLRLDRHPLVDLSRTLSPRGAAILRVADRTAIRATAGTSFRAPTLMESYLDFYQPADVDGVNVHIVGNENLLPERIFTAEVGIHDESSAYHRADVALYMNRISDIIFVTSVVPEINAYNPDVNAFVAGTTAFDNLSPVSTAYGVELDGRLFPIDGLDLFANLALQRVREESDEGTAEDPDTAPLKLNAGVIWRSPWRMDLSAQVQHVSATTWRLREYDPNGQLVVEEVETPARTLPIARIAGRPFADEALELSVSAWNIPALWSDEARVREHPKGQLVGGRVAGAVEYRF